MKLSISSLFLASIILLSSNALSQDVLFWSDVQTGKIMRSNTDGSDPTALLSQNMPRFITDDTIYNRLYWTDAGTNEIIRINYNGTGRRAIASGMVNPYGIAIGPDSALYVINDGQIQRYDTSGVLLSVVHDNVQNAADLVIAGAQLYWSNAADKVIETSGLDGENRQVLINNAINPIDLDVDPVHQKLYWIQYTGAIPGSGIFTADLNGSNKTLVVEEFAKSLAVDGDNQWLYWAPSNFFRVMRTNLADTSEVSIFMDDLTDTRSIVLNKTENKIFLINRHYAEFLFSANLSNGSSRTRLAASSVYFPTRFEIDTIGKKIYWINSKSSFTDDVTVGLMRANLDGSGVEFLITNPELKNPFGIALNVEGNKIYWSDRGRDAIGSAELDGSNIQYIVTTGLENTVGLRLDKVGQKLYWADWGTDKIQRCNLDGSGVEDVITTGLTSPYDVAFLPAEGKLYWTDYGDGTIKRSDMDGQNVETIVNTGSVTRKPNAIFVDQPNQKLYFTIEGSGDKVQRSNFDGTQLEDVVTENIQSPHDVAVISSPIINQVEAPIKPAFCKVSPNPFKDEFILESTIPVHFVQMYNLTGQVVYSRELSPEDVSHRIIVSHLSAGMYTLVANLKNGKRDVIKVILHK